MNKSVVLHGPEACGKTRNGKALAKALRLESVQELDEFPYAGRKTTTLTPYGVLYLTNDPQKAEMLAKVNGLTLVSFATAIKEATV